MFTGQDVGNKVSSEEVTKMSKLYMYMYVRVYMYMHRPLGEHYETLIACHERWVCTNMVSCYTSVWMSNYPTFWIS